MGDAAVTGRYIDDLLVAVLAARGIRDAHIDASLAHQGIARDRWPLLRVATRLAMVEAIPTDELEAEMLALACPDPRVMARGAA